MNIEVIRDNASGLARECWRFWADTSHGGDITLHLSGYRRETRATTRHKFRAAYDGIYSRIDRRSGSLTVNDVPRPADVAEEVLAKVTQNIRIVIEDGRGVTAPFAALTAG